jgi:hypothetical protein
MPWPKVLTPWLADVRKAALIAGVAAVLGVLMPAWSAARTMLAIETMRQWSVPLIVLIWCFTAIVPAFCFALYRNEGPLDFPRNLRVLSLTAAIVLGVVTLAALPQWIESLGSYWADISTLDWTAGAATVSIVVRKPGTFTQIATLLGEFSNLTYIALLIAIFRQAGGQPRGEISRPLAVVSKVAVIAWGVWVAFNVVRLVFTPYTYFQLRDFALQVGRTPPRLEAMMVDVVRTILSQACLFTAPYVVYRSCVRRADATARAVSTP